MRSLPVLLLAAVCLSACLRRPVNRDCQWPPEADAKPLDLTRAADQRRLNADVEFAEDLAIRYMDAHPVGRSGDFQTANAVRNQCLTKLFGSIMTAHRVTPAQIMSSLGRRPVAFDAAVMLSFGLLYAWGVSVAAGRLRRSGKGIVLTVYVSLALAAVGVLLGDQWAGLMENLRLGNGHLSYRVDRVPWGHHHLELFLAALAIFWILAAWQRRQTI